MVYSTQERLGQATRDRGGEEKKKLRRLTISQLPTAVKWAEKYEHTVHEALQDELFSPQSPFYLHVILSHFFFFYFFLFFASNHVTQVQRNVPYITDLKEKREKERQ